MIVAERIYVVEITAPARRAFANGIISAGQSAGTVMGPVIGGFLAAYWGLRAPFILVAATSLIALVGTFFLRGRPRPMEAAADDGTSEPIPFRPLATLLAANLALLATYGGFITTYAAMATTQLDWSTLEVGIAFSFFGAGSIILGPALANLADRVGRRLVATIAPLALVGFGGGLVLGLPQPIVFGLAFLGGGGLTAFSASWYALLADAAGQRRLGRTFGIVNAASNLGIVIGATMAAELWARVGVAAGMMVGVVFPFIAVGAMLTFRPRVT